MDGIGKCPIPDCKPSLPPSAVCVTTDLKVLVLWLFIIESLPALFIVSPHSNPPTLKRVVNAPCPLNPCWFTDSLMSGTTVNVLPDLAFAVANVCSIVMFFLCCLVAPI